MTTMTGHDHDDRHERVVTKSTHFRRNWSRIVAPVCAEERRAVQARDIAGAMT
jgi:hypothetical protein